MTKPSIVRKPYSGGPQFRACLVLLAASAGLAPLSAAGEEVRDEPVPSRLDELNSRLERLEDMLDRIETLLRDVHGERLRHIEALAVDPEIVDAIGRIEERYALTGVTDALTAIDDKKVLALQYELSRAAAERDEIAFARDPDVAIVVAAMAARRDYFDKYGHKVVTAVMGRRVAAAAALVESLLELPSESAHEAALWGALGIPLMQSGTLRGGAAPDASLEPLRRRLSAYALDVGEKKPRFAALACAASAVHGDERATDELARLVRSGAISGWLGNKLAGELRRGGSKSAFKIYLALLLDERYAVSVAGVYNMIDGFDRRVNPRDVRLERKKLHGEFSDWLERNWALLRFDPARRRFTVKETRPGGSASPPAGTLPARRRVRKANTNAR